MEYSEYAQIGGIGSNMPAPQLFYPEMNVGQKMYEQSAVSQVRSPQFEGNYYEGDFKQNQQHTSMRNEPSGDYNYRPQSYPTNSAFAYRGMVRQNQRSREMRARNGLYSPGDCFSRQSEYPTFKDLNARTRGSNNSYW